MFHVKQRLTPSSQILKHDWGQFWSHHYLEHDMDEQQQQKDNIESQQLMERVRVKGLEGQPQEALVDIVQVDEKNEHFPQEPRFYEQFAVEYVCIVGVCSHRTFGQLIMNQLLAAMCVYVKPTLHKSTIIILRYGVTLRNCLYFYFMEKTNNSKLPINRAALHKYINTLFPDIDLPSIDTILALQRSQQQTISGITIKLQPNILLSAEEATLLQSQAILHLHLGSVELHRQLGRRWQRQIELKQGFFTLVNFRNMESIEPQWFRMTVKKQSTVTILPLKYSYTWLRDGVIKNQILAKIFYFNDTGIQIDRKKERFKEFVNNFKHEVIRRETRFVVQGQKNHKIYIIGKGEAKMYKDMHIKSDKGEITKNTEIFFIRDGFVIGAELFLMNSKAIHTIISNHSSLQQEQIHQYDEQQEDAVQDGNKEHQKNKKKGRHNKHRKIRVQSGGYELYAPHYNISNYSVVAQSANLEVYTIPIDSLVATIFERQKINFVKMLQQTYITIFRRTHEKMEELHHKQEDKADKVNQKINIVTSKIYASGQANPEPIGNGIIIRRSEIGLANNDVNKFRREDIRNNQNKKLEKRAQLMIQQHKPKTDFKVKIQALLEEKLKKSGCHLDVEQEAQLVHSLGEIFRKNNEGRTEDVFVQNEVLDKKTILLGKRGGWKPGWDMLTSEATPTLVRRSSSLQINYLKHTSREELAYKVKEKYIGKIHQANKIKEQFMKIKSECPCCSCYDNFEKFNMTSRRTMSNFTRVAYRTADGWGRASKANSSKEEPPLEQVYSQMKFLSQKSKQKYNHNVHLLKCRRNKDKLERRKSAPVL